MNEHAAYADLKKVELHCHLELAFRPSTLKHWALQAGLQVESDADFARHFLIREPMSDLPTVLRKFLDVRDLLASEEMLEQLAFEVCEDMHVHHGVRVLELRYAPSFLLDKHTHLNADRLQAAILRGCARAEALYPLATGLVCILQRTHTAEENARWLDFALTHRDGFVGVDLADNEVDCEPEPFIPLFQRAKAAGFGITIHAGEPAVPGISRNIITAIEGMGADRIGHGVQAIHDPEAIRLLADRGIPLELCPTSNRLTQAVPSLDEYPLLKLRDAGVKVTVNTDDPGIMDTNLSREYALMAKHLGVTRADLEQFNAWARAASFIDHEKIERAMAAD